MEGESVFPEEIQAGCVSYYGVSMQPIGDDGEVMLILGHHDAKRAIAALNKYHRDHLGMLNMFDDTSVTFADAREEVEVHWARLLTECMATKHPEHREDCWLCADIRATTERDGSWWVGYNFAEQDADVFPVMVWAA